MQKKCLKSGFNFILLAFVR